MRKFNLFLKAKIILALILAFFTVRFFAGKVFLDNSPIISPAFIAKVKNTPQFFAGIFNQSKDFIASLPYFNRKNNETAAIVKSIPQTVSPPDIAFVPVAKGISSGVSASSQTRYIKIEKGTKVEVATQKLPNGRQIKVLIPAK